MNDSCKCSCSACGEILEFPARQVGQTIPCPYCNSMTLLAAALPRPRTHSDMQEDDAAQTAPSSVRVIRQPRHLPREQPFAAPQPVQVVAVPMQVMPSHYATGHVFCNNCGTPIAKTALMCLRCGAARPGAPVSDSPIVDGPTDAPVSRIVYVMLGFFFGGLGVHNFVAGYTQKGATQAAITVAGLVLSSEVRREAGLPFLLAVGIWCLYEIITVKKDAHGRPFS